MKTVCVNGTCFVQWCVAEINGIYRELNRVDNKECRILLFVVTVRDVEPYFGDSDPNSKVLKFRTPAPGL